jgi:phosphopantothenoylcysteine decarboxylase/phosphopantothenate--cysteine ligase
MPLAGRRIVLGVSGGIAAYKAAFLARRLIESGCEVRVVMTDAATEFIGEATMAGLTGHPVLTRLTGHPGSVSPHTDLARWADLIIVAPATAATLARFAHGISQDALGATLLAGRAPVLVAPAMHTEMWEHPATRRAVALLLADGVRLVGPQEGALAGGDIGLGRMVEPEDIVAAAGEILSGPLEGVRVLVTAGGTREPIDPVRYLGNRSSGKMGHAIADEAARRGATVTLVTASSLPVAPGVERLQVETALEMEKATAGVEADVAVMAAAVADFRPVVAAERKLSREDGPPQVTLEPNPDILAGVAARSPRPFLVGFAAETGGLDRAVAKAARKGVDLLVANDVSEEGSGFSVDTNRVTIVRPDGATESWPQMAKVDVARRLWDLIAAEYRPT